MGGDRLLDHVRRRPAPGRSHGRPARTAAPVHGRAGALHRQLAARRARLVGGLPDRFPCWRARRGAGLPGRAVDPDDHLPRGQRAQLRPWNLGRRFRQRRRSGRAARRRAHQLAHLVVGLLHQRPRRRARAGVHAAIGARERRRRGPPALRRARRCLDHRRADAVGVRHDALPSTDGARPRRSDCWRPRPH